MTEIGTVELVLAALGFPALGWFIVESTVLDRRRAAAARARYPEVFRSLGLPSPGADDAGGFETVRGTIRGARITVEPDHATIAISLAREPPCYFAMRPRGLDRLLRERMSDAMRTASRYAVGYDGYEPFSSGDVAFDAWTECRIGLAGFDRLQANDPEFRHVVALASIASRLAHLRVDSTTVRAGLVTRRVTLGRGRQHLAPPEAYEEVVVRLVAAAAALERLAEHAGTPVNDDDDDDDEEDDFD